MNISDKNNTSITTSNNYILVYLTIIVVFSLLLPFSALSQGYAGPDKTIMKDSSVVIGGKNNCNNCCYNWSPATGLSSTTVKNPTANPQTTTTYTLKVTGDNFNISDVSQMTVTVKDGMDGLTVTPKKCCFKKDEAIKLEDFTITTNPPGLEKNVTLSPATVPGNIFLNTSPPFTANSEASLPVTFTARGSNNTTKTATVNIPCVDKDASLQVSIGMGPLNQAKLLEAVDKCINNVAAVGGCNATGGPTVNVSHSRGKMCCEKSGCVKDYYTWNGTFNYSKGVDCDFIWYGLPYCASINGRLSAGAGITVNLNNAKTSCDGIENCIGVTVSASVGGGVSLTVGGGKLLNASLMLVGTVTVPAYEYCIPSGKTKIFPSEVCLQADIVGTYKVLGFITEKVSVSFINKRCWGNN